MNCNASHHLPVTQNPQYFYCQNCGEYSDAQRSIVVARSAACPNRDWHHCGDVYAVCGSDERVIGKWTMLDDEALIVLRQKRGLSPISSYRTWSQQRQQLIQRIRAGATIASNDYLQIDMHSASSCYCL